MKIYRHILKPPCFLGNPRLLGSNRAGAFLHHIRWAALPAVMLAVVVLLATGCSSTGAGFNARLISPIPTDLRTPNSEDDGSYPPARSPALSDFGFLGGA
jgi:hypothetical protein